MHPAGAVRHSGNVGISPDTGALCSAVRRHPHVEPRCSGLRGNAGACLHEDGNGGALRSDRSCHSPAWETATAEARGGRKAAAGPREIFWGKDGFVDASADDGLAGEGELRPATKNPSLRSVDSRGGCPYVICFAA